MDTVAAHRTCAQFLAYALRHVEALPSHRRQKPTALIRRRIQPSLAQVSHGVRAFVSYRVPLHVRMGWARGL